MKKSKLLLIFTIPMLVISVLMNILLASSSKEIFENGQRDMYHKLNQALGTVEEVLGDIRPPKNSQYAEQQFNSKGEAHPRIIKSASLEDFVYNNCVEEVYDVMPDTIEYARSKGVAPHIIYAIAWADTQCGKALTTPYNYGNVNNNDRGNRVGYFTPQAGMRAIVDTLTNKYMSGLTKIGQLSQGGRTIIGSKYSCSEAPAPFKCYATSVENWNRNVIFALNEMSAGFEVTEEAVFRITP